LSIDFPTTSPAFPALVLLALIQGLTEFLPVSSSGHLVLVQTGLGLHQAGMLVDVALHVGTLAAVLIAYRKDLLAIGRELVVGRPRELLLLAIGTVPAGVVGVVWKDAIEARFAEPRSAAWGLCATAGILLAGELSRRARGVRDPVGAAGEAGGGAMRRSPGVLGALAIGLAQALAIWPGISRSGTTITAGLLLGLEPKQAARFSFLLSIPAILGAAVLNTPAALEEGAGVPGAELAFAVGLSGLVGWGALRLLIAFLGRGAFAWFAVYCAALGIGFLVFA